MAGDFGTEVAKAGPVEAFVQIDFGDDDFAPLFGLVENAAFAVVNGGEHPVGVGVGVGAADEVDVIFAGAGGGEERVAAPNWEGDDFGAVESELAGNFGEKAVVANHHAEFAETCVEDGVFVARSNAAFDFAARESDFAVFAGDFAVGRDEDGDVVDVGFGAFHEAGDDVVVMFAGELGEVVGGGAGDGFGGVAIGDAVAD